MITAEGGEAPIRCLALLLLLQILGRSLAAGGITWSPTPWSGGEFERVAKPIANRELERGAVAGDTYVPSAVDAAIADGQQLAGEHEGVPDTHGEAGMQLASERQVQESRVWNTTGDSAAFHVYLGHRKMGENVIHPFLWSADSKCSNGNAIGSQ